MLAALGHAPVTHTPRPEPRITAPRWFSGAPRRADRSERVQIALGVWIVRYRSAGPGSLDTAADLPDHPSQDVPGHRAARSPAATAWQRGALCRSLPLELSDPLFFGTEDRQAPEDLIVAVETARRVCKVCPVRAECLEWALTNDMRYGVWGGTSGKQREKMRLRLATGASLGELVDECLE